MRAFDIYCADGYNPAERTVSVRGLICGFSVPLKKSVISEMRMHFTAKAVQTGYYSLE